MKPLYQIMDAERPYIWTRQAEPHDLAEHLLHHPYWQTSVRPVLPENPTKDGNPPPRDGILESADRLYLPPGVPANLLIGLQSIVDGWVMTKG